MIQITSAPRKSSVRWVMLLAVVGSLHTPASGFWSGTGWARERREAPIIPMTGQPASPDPTPGGLRLHEPTGGALGTARASCDKGAEIPEALTLPGARGEVKLDRCYRGRDQLVCSL